MTTRDLLNLPKEILEQGLSKLAQFFTAEQWQAMIAAGEDSMQRFIAASPAEPFSEPLSHLKAREILGNDFHGINVVQNHLGMYSPRELHERIPLRIRDKTGIFLTEEETLQVCEECKGDFFLCSTFSEDLLGIHARMQTRFMADPDQPWFENANEQIKWASTKINDPWLLVRKEIVPGTTNKTIDHQRKVLADHFPKERILLPVEWANVALVRFCETGEKMPGNFVIRFFVQLAIAKSDWLCAEWHGSRLCFEFADWQGAAVKAIGVATARVAL